ncbi:MAG: hypothetical protein EBS01_01240 [Verrucomicrobia bacterium]|nr:hypothetical protein [Verrucomicrobiota bacterium]
MAASVAEGAPLSLSVTATGGSLSYVWTKDGTTVAGATGGTLSIGSLAVTDGGVYQVRVANAFSFALSNLVTVNVARKLGVSLTANVSVKSGEGVSLVPTITGSDANTTLQWKKNGRVVAGSTSEQYRISSATDADEAVYTLVASKTRNGVVVETAQASVSVAVLKLPEILAGPVSLTVLGTGTSTGSVVFSVAARSNTPLSYNWSRDGVTLGTGAALRLTGASAGTYTVTVTNAVGSVTRSATLTLSSSAVATHHAGSTNDATDTRNNVYSKWWVYSADLADANGTTHRAGYWLLERSRDAQGKVTTGKSAWITEPAVLGDPILAATDRWNEGDQTVQDSADSAVKTFSVVAYRTDSDSFTIAGRVEAAGTAAYYGAPDAMAGDYAQGDAELEWDTEKVDILQSNSDFESAVTQLKHSLEIELASAPGE